jgi:hypothetical protein
MAGMERSQNDSGEPDLKPTTVWTGNVDPRKHRQD